MNNKIIALIPARGGSKGVIRKNIREVGGQPLIAYTIKAALEVFPVEDIIVSTDDIDIAEVASSYGVKVPFLRPDEFAQDTSSDQQVIDHLLTWFESKQVSVDGIVYLRPTTPFKTPEILKSAVDMLKAGDYACIRSVTPCEGANHPYWMFKQNSTGCTLDAFIDGININNYYQRQLLPDAYRLNGVCDGINVKAYRENNQLWASPIGMLKVDEEHSLDIDTELDLEYFELILSRSRSNDNVE